MNKGAELERILTDSSPQKTALKGLVSKLGHFYKKWNIKGMSRPYLIRQCEYDEAYSPSFVNKTKLLLVGLIEIGYKHRANYLINSFIALTDAEKELMNPTSFSKRFIKLVGEILENFYSEKWQILELKMCEMADLMKVRLV